MLGCAFFVTLFGALIGANSWWLVLGFGGAWVVKECLRDWFDGEVTLERQPSSASGMGKEIMHFGIQAGLEVYSHQPLVYGVRCKIVVQGIDDYLHSSGPGGGWGTAKLDAVYLLGDGQYVRHHSLFLDRQPAMLFLEDPHQHRYSFLYTGTGRQLSVLLRIPPEHKSQHAWPLTDKPLQISVRTLTEAEEVTIRARENEQQSEKTENWREELHRQALELATVAYVENRVVPQ